MAAPEEVIRARHREGNTSGVRSTRPKIGNETRRGKISIRWTWSRKARTGKGLEPLPTQDGLICPVTSSRRRRRSTGKPKVENAGRSGATPPTSPLYKPKPLAKQYLEALERINKNGAVAAAPQAEPADATRIAPVKPVV